MYILRYQNFKFAIIHNIRRSNISRSSVRYLDPKCNCICKEVCIHFGKEGDFWNLKIIYFAQISKRQLFLTSFLLPSYFFPNQPVTAYILIRNNGMHGYISNTEVTNVRISYSLNFPSIFSRVEGVLLEAKFSHTKWTREMKHIPPPHVTPSENPPSHIWPKSKIPKNCN